MNSLAQQISAARAAKGWTQSEMATEMGVSQQTIAHWESGVMPRGKKHAKLHTLLGIDVFKQRNDMKDGSIDVKEAVEVLHRLSAVLYNGSLDEDDTLSIISAIDTLGTMLARWHYIR